MGTKNKTSKDFKELKSFTVIQRTYEEALSMSKNILDIVENFKNLLRKDSVYEEIPLDEKENFLRFVSSIEDCYYERKSTFQLTNLLTDVATLMMYVILFFNDTTNSKRLDISIHSRRKALKRDLAKILRKSYEKDFSGVKDRFGIRVICLNNDMPKKEIEATLLKFFNFSIGILTNSNKKRSEFINWIENNSSLDNFTKLRLKQTLSLPFKIDRIKDLVTSPKDNGYQSIHCTLVLPVYSEMYSGAILDLQFRSFEMHKQAESRNPENKVSHMIYEKEAECYTKYFEVTDFSKLNIIGFSGNSPEEDMDGINNPKSIVNRRISSNLVF